jgi:Uri superfamily endonuclease
MPQSPIKVRPGTDGTDPLPAEAGAYVLMLDLAKAVPIRVATLPRIHLPPGRYAYVGSAKGSGGIRARVRRHLGAEKKIHWHVDHLTAAARVDEVLAYPGASECDIVQRLLRRRGASVPVAGFGSSDCKRCAAHLLVLG